MHSHELTPLTPDDPGLVARFLQQYVALVRSTGMYVDQDGLAMPIDAPGNEMESAEEHLARICAAEGFLPPPMMPDTAPRRGRSSGST